MKKYIYLIISLLIVVIGSGIIYFQNHKADNTVNCSGSVMCSAQSFQNTNDGAYLEITIDNEKHTKKKLPVNDQKLIDELSEKSIEKIIGVNLTSSIPDAALEGKADYYIKDSIQLLIDYDDYDKYFEIVDVSYGEVPDVVKTYDATPEDKISEYIKNGELCYSSTHYEMSDGTWKVKEHPYTYKYRLELTGRLHNAVKNSTYIILSNRNDITFEQAWKASGLSSNTEDYFDTKDAIIVGSK